MADELKAMATRIAANLANLDEQRRRVGLEGMKALERLDPETANMAKSLWDHPLDAVDWFTQEVESLGWQTPWQCMADGGREDVQRIIASIQYGLPA